MTSAQQNFVHSGTIFSAAGISDLGPNLKIWHAEKIDLEESFPTVPNLKGLPFFIAEIIDFKVCTNKNRKNVIFLLSEDAKELKNFLEGSGKSF